MFQLFHALAARLKALFVANVALDFESEFASRNAERKALLLQQATEYEKSGLPEVASELRQRADEIDIQKPLASILPSIEHWQAHDNHPVKPTKPALPHRSSKQPQLLSGPSPKTRRKGRR